MVFFAIAVIFTNTMQAQVPTSEPRLWVLDLGMVPSYRELRLNGKEVAQAASVVFVDSKTVAVTYRVAPDGRPSTEGTDSVAFVDAESGAVRDSLRWATPNEFPADRNFVRLLPTHNGEFLVVVGRFVRHFSASHKELNTRELPIAGNGRWEWVVRVSPDGQMALMKRFGPGVNEDHWLSAETLEDRTVAPAPFYGYGYEVGPGFVVYNASGQDSETRNQVRIHTSAGDDRILCTECKGANFGIVRDRVFFGGLPAGTGVVTGMDGSILLRKKFGRKNQLVGQVSVARDSTQVAFYMSYLENKLFHGFQAISRIVVLDTATLHESRRFDFADSGERQDGGERFLWPIMAISPDGTKLALLWRTASAYRHDRLEVFPLVHN